MSLINPASQAISVGLDGKILLCSGCLSDLEDEAALVGFLGSALAPIIAKHEEERQTLQALRSITIAFSAPLVVTASSVPSLWALGLPCIAYTSYFFRQSEIAMAKFDGEKDLIALKLLRQCGYDSQSYMEYRERDLNKRERLLSRSQALKTVQLPRVSTQCSIWIQIRLTLNREKPELRYKQKQLPRYTPNLVRPNIWRLSDIFLSTLQQRLRLQRMKELVPQIAQDSTYGPFLEQASRPLPKIDQTFEGDKSNKPEESRNSTPIQDD
jgi:hypothetical protein